MPRVWVPALLRDLTGGQDTVTVAGTRVSEVIEEMERRYPGTMVRLCNADGLKPGLAVFIDNEVSRLGLRQPVGPESEVHFVPAIGGG